MENELLQDTRKHFSRLGLAYFLGSLIIILIQLAATKIAGHLDPDMATSNYSLYFAILMLSMYLISMPLMGFLISRTQPKSTLPKHKMTVGQWLIAFLICYGAVYVGNFIGNLLTQMIAILKGHAVTNVLGAVLTNLNPFTAFFITVICAPIAEELLFRKLLIERTIQYGEGISVLLSGLLFGLFHGNLNQFVYAFLLGCFFGFIFLKTGDVRYTISMHMLVNFLGSIVSMQILRVSGLSDLLTASASSDVDIMALCMQHLPGLVIYLLYVIAMIGITIAGVILFIVNFRHFTLVPSEITVPRGVRFKAYIGNLGMILFGLFWIGQMIYQLLQ